MKSKNLLFGVCTVLFLFLFSPNLSAQTCCKVPDSLKVLAVTKSFKVGWHVNDSIPCDTIIGATVQWRKVGTTSWSSAAITHGSSVTITFEDTAGGLHPIPMAGA